MVVKARFAIHVLLCLTGDDGKGRNIHVNPPHMSAPENIKASFETQNIQHVVRYDI